MMKKKARQHMREVLAAMAPSDRASRSVFASAGVVTLQEFRVAQTVMVYLPMAQEVDTTAIIEAAWQSGKTVLAPKVFFEERRMIACPIRSLREGLKAGQYNILEPLDAQPYPPERIDFIVVPAMAFDRRGGRLGRGAGFYDRFLAQPGMHAITCGLAFSPQLLAELPVFDHDKCVDIVVTDSEVLDLRSTR